MTTLEVSHLSRTFRVHGKGPRLLRAVDDVSFTLRSGETTALVGESGSGKSTIARVLARLLKPSAGEIWLDGEAVRQGPRAVRRYRSDVQMVFQDPFSSLNPSHTVGYHLRRPLQLHGFAPDRAAARSGVLELLDRVNLRPAEQVALRYPHELSGGQRQRVAIARALAPRPRVLLADEPVSMLDVSIRLGVLNLLRDLKDRLNLAILYITHDIAYFASSIMVMYRGQIVESGPSDAVILRPAHPYTRLLASAAPDPDRVRPPVDVGLRALRGAAQAPTQTGCLFRSRCQYAMRVCEQDVPVFGIGEAGSAGGTGGHQARCWLLDPTTDRRGDAGEAVPEADRAPAPAV